MGTIMRQTDWTPERIAEMLRLREMGYSCAIIACRLQGPTRNAVIGKLTRLGLGRPRPTEQRKTGRPRRVSRPAPLPPPRAHWRPPIAPIPPPRVDDIATVALIDLEEHHCRFPVGETNTQEFGFCGQTHVPGTSYCAGHLARCTTEWIGRTAHAHNRMGGTQTAAALTAEMLEPA